MEKFIKLAGARLYGVDIKVEFPFCLASGFRVWGGECDRDNKRILFNGRIFQIDELPHDAWYVLLHELTHLKHHGHTNLFWEEVANNFEKTIDLREQFYRESGLDGDSYIDMDYDEYEDDDPVPENLDEEDYEYDDEHCDDEDIYFSYYNPFQID